MKLYAFTSYLWYTRYRQYRGNRVKEHTRAYTAGLMDGDGNLSILKKYDSDGYDNFSVQIRFYNTNLQVMKWMVETFGGTYRIDREETSRNKTGYSWMPNGAEHQKWFILRILPYLQLKTEEAEIILEYISLNGKKHPERRRELWVRSEQLKTRDSVTTETLNLPKQSNLINAYFAGLFDAEGCSSIKKTEMSWGFHYASDVSISNAYLPVLTAAKQLYGGGKIGSRRRKEHYQIANEWGLWNHKQQELFLLKVMPYLKIKQVASNAVLQFIRLNGQHDPTKREALYQITTKENGRKIQSKLAG